jgi:peptidoglycan/xylan/chitin deacetylase (PgdA/CDA1 family)
LKNIIRYYLVRKYKQLRCFLIRRHQNANFKALDRGYLTIFHDYEGKYALPHVGDISLKGVNYILDVEISFHIKATYNIVGKLIKDYPKIVRRIISDGHELASHSFNHQIMADLSFKKVSSDIEESKKNFHDLGINLSGFRSPQSKWSFTQMHAMLEQGLCWTAENDSAWFPYVLIKKNGKQLIRLPIKMDDWDYIKKNIHPDIMLKRQMKIVEKIAKEKLYGAIGFHPWIQGADKKRLLMFKTFLEIISRNKNLKIITFCEMHDRYLKNKTI